jgi:cellulose biosynthesis protein BcsQ
MTIKICLFNHKGGVCKTTDAFNLGWMLANQGKKVLLVDADSQCNLTNIFLTDDKFEDFYLQYPQRNIKEFLSPVFDGKAVSLKAAECAQNERQKALWLIPGSFDLSEYDVSLGLSFTASQTITSIKNLPGSFNRLIEDTAKKYQADYTLVDMNPSLSAINQTLLLSCDYFIIPAVPDYFSIMAIRSLARIIPKWEKWGERARKDFETSIYPFPKKTPQFLGSIIQRYGIRRGRQSEQRQPSRANRDLIDDFKKTLCEDLVPALSEVKMLLPPEKYSKDYCLGSVQDFHSLNACYHRFGLPLFEISDDQLRSIGHAGTAAKNDKGIIDAVRTSVSDMCEKITQISAVDVVEKKVKRKPSKLS